jgi:hypothetical protein
MPETTFVPSATTQLTYSNLFLLTAESNCPTSIGARRELQAVVRVFDLGAAWNSGNVVVGFLSTVLQQRALREQRSRHDSPRHPTLTPRLRQQPVSHLLSGRHAVQERRDRIGALTRGLDTPDQGTRIFQGDPVRRPVADAARQRRRARSSPTRSR